MNWCFGIVNGRLAEVFFNTSRGGKKRIFAHAHVTAREYKSKQEKQWIKRDTKKVHVSYRNKEYQHLDS